MSSSTFVINRHGKREPVSFDKILSRIDKQSHGLRVDTVKIAQQVVQGVRDGVTTSELDDLTVSTATMMMIQHPDYSRLAARIAVDNLHKKTTPSIEAVFFRMGEEEVTFAKEHMETINSSMDWSVDYEYDIFGYKTLEQSYLIRDPKTNDVVERPQVMLMRVSIGIHCGNLNLVLETYNDMKNKLFTHATPTMFNAATKNPSLASCYLLPVMEDSISGIFRTLERCSMISKSAGGIGLSFTNVRASGSLIKSTGGKSAGLLPFARIYDATARAVDQGGGKRKGAFALYLEPWHKDILTFLSLKKHHGTDELRARDLFYALWIPDLFMKRVQEGGEWTLFCPSQCHDLIDSYGKEFEALYESYEKDSSIDSTKLPAREIWNSILDSQIETGTPYMLYKDSVNYKSNHKHLGTIRNSNLCTEIMQFSSKDEIAVCNLASIALPKFATQSSDGEYAFDFEEFMRVVRTVTNNLDRVIDRTEYVLPEARTSNLKHRPIGIGVQGLADVFMIMKYPFDSVEARVLNKDIFEAMYFAALDASCSIAEQKGPYESYNGSPLSEGKLQFDMWSDQGQCNLEFIKQSRHDWNSLRDRIKTHGVRNSLLVAPMPTASTAQILGNNECFEPITSNCYHRRVLAGEFPVINKYLVADLENMNMWTPEVRSKIIANNGSVQNLSFLPENLKKVYKTAWEISQRALIDMSADRGVFVCQSQSLNLFLGEPDHAKLSSMHFYGFKKGLKTGMYYLRTQPAVDPVKVTLPSDVCRRDNPEACTACSA